MSLFHSNIDPFSSFTINLGPLYVERVFDSLLIKQGIPDVVSMSAPVRFEHYLGHLRTMSGPGHHRRYPVIQFYKAHFFQQTANYSIHCENSVHFQEKALCYYQTFLELVTPSDESHYYAQWQVGMLQDVLNYPWPMAEESLMKANAIDPLRGEANKRIIDHYFQKKEWKTAYGYSSMAIRKFFEKNPAAYRRWFVDFSAYDGTVIDTHHTICHELGYHKEAQQTYDQINSIKHGTINKKTEPEHSEF